MFSKIEYIDAIDNISLRCGSLTSSKNKAKAVILGGRTEYLEKYAETAKDLKSRGFNVYSFDWRGQGLSKRPLNDRLKGHVGDFQEYLDDLSLFIERIVRPQDDLPIILLAHSMGGHIALRFLNENPDVFDWAVLSSPMIDIKAPFILRLIMKLMIRLAIKRGKGTSYAPASEKYYALNKAFPKNRFTSDYNRFMEDKKIMDENPQIALGGPTFKWMAESLDSIELLASDQFGKKIKTPILMIGAGNDKIVSLDAMDMMTRKLSNCRLIKIPDARHEILRETDEIRSIFWKEFDLFIKELN